MSGHSPIDSLRRLAPVSDADAAALFGTAGREELLAEVTRLPFGRGAEPRRVAPRRRRLVLALAAFAVVAVATAATWVVLSNGPARETTSVECVIKGVDTIIPSTSGDPAQDCAVEWKRELGQAAPPLLAYDNGHGGVTVLMRSATPPAGFKRLVAGQDADLIQLQNSLDDFVNGLNSSCLGNPGATTLTESKLARFGFTGWIVSSRGASSPGTAPPAQAGTRTAPTVKSDGNICWNGDIVDPSTQSVTLIASSDQNGGTPTSLADKLRPIARQCQSLPDAVASVRNAANGLGLSESAKTYELNTATDNSMRCASIYETVGGTIFLTVRGPGR
jgi:hypothetical protein